MNKLFVFIITFLLIPFFILGKPYDNSERWLELKESVFGDAELKEGTEVFNLNSLSRAIQGSHVPVSVELLETDFEHKIEKIILIADNNPVPIIATITFKDGYVKGTRFSTVVRIEEYTPVRGIAKFTNGDYYMNSVFVKASGGCSGELISTDQKIDGATKFTVNSDKNISVDVAKFEVSHPNYSGLQFDQLTRNYIPMDYINSYEVLIDGKEYFNFDSSIAVSTNPYFEISLPKNNFSKIELKMVDLKGNNFDHTWNHSK